MVLNAKLFLQSLWKGKINWDDLLTTQEREIWSNIKEDLKKLENVKFRRYIQSTERNELISFSDASKDTFCVAIYLRAKVTDEWVSNRLSPKRRITIPRMELIAATIGTRAIGFLRKILEIPIVKCRAFTDSKCVLYWLKSKKPLSVFVENRIREITKMKELEFRFVSTKDNVADIGTKPCQLEDHYESCWFEGPKWLKKDESDWPKCESELDKADLEECSQEEKAQNRSTTLMVAEGPDGNLSPFELIVEDFSTLSRLLRITAWCLRFIQKTRNLLSQCRPLNSAELESARELWERHVQSRFAKNQKNSKNRKMNLVSQLGIELDEKGIMRCHGRLSA